MDILSKASLCFQAIIKSRFVIFLKKQLMNLYVFKIDFAVFFPGLDYAVSERSTIKSHPTKPNQFCCLKVGQLRVVVNKSSLFLKEYANLAMSTLP